MPHDYDYDYDYDYDVTLNMILTMVSYHHHEAPRAVWGSVGGCPPGYVVPLRHWAGDLG